MAVFASINVIYVWIKIAVNQYQIAQVNVKCDSKPLIRG